jgi:hypothetical protein
LHAYLFCLFCNYFVLLYFSGIFPLLPKMHFVFLSLLVFLHSFTGCTLSYCIFRSLDMPSKNKTANSLRLMYVVFPFCWRFLPPHGCFFWYLGIVFFVLFSCNFNDYRVNSL